MYGRLETEGQEQCCRIAVCTDITGHEQTKNGHQRKHLNILNLIHFQSRFFFSPVDLYTGKEGRPHMRAQPARTIAVYSYFFVEKSRP